MAEPEGAAPAQPRPDLRAVQAALRKTTEVLAQEPPRRGRPLPSGRRASGSSRARPSRYTRVSRRLAQRLRWAGPQDWLPFLQAQRAQIALRQERIRQLVQQIDAAGRKSGLTLIALKGAGLRRAGSTPQAGRPSADLDLLVHEAHTGQAAELLPSSAIVPPESPGSTTRLFRPLGPRARGRSGSGRTIPSRSSCTPASASCCRCARWTSRA